MGVCRGYILAYVILFPSFQCARLKKRLAVLFAPSMETGRFKETVDLSLSSDSARADIQRAFIGVNESMVIFQDSYEPQGAPSESVSLPDTWQPYFLSRKKVGNGAFGDVAMVNVQCPARDPSILAMKVIPQEGVEQSKKKLLNNEMSSIAEVTGFLSDPAKAKIYKEDMRPYVLSLIGKPTVAAEHLFILSPFFSNGEFKDVLNNEHQEAYGGLEAMYGFILHIAKGVDVMHKAGWVHGDLKGENAMVSCVDGSTAIGNCHAAVIDFGLACRIDANDCGKVGTPLYVAPEVLSRSEDGANPDPKTDVWSLGIMLWEVRFGYENLPTQARSLPQVFKKVMALDQHGTSIPALSGEPDLEDLLQGMLAKRLEQRLEMPQVIAKLETMVPEEMLKPQEFDVLGSSTECLQPGYKPPVHPIIKENSGELQSSIKIGGNSGEFGSSSGIGRNSGELVSSNGIDRNSGKLVSRDGVSRNISHIIPAARAQVGESFQCCYETGLNKGWIFRSNSHYMTKEGEACRSSTMKVHVDYESCNTLAGGRCGTCWNSCCRVRHPSNREKCHDEKSTLKRYKHCKEAGSSDR